MALVILTVFKVLVCLTGFGFSAFYFFPAIKRGDKSKMKKAGLVFLSTWFMIIIITSIEFIIIGYI
jgi:hypothetical protein